MIKLNKAEKALTKEYDGKLYIDWEGAYLNKCETKEDIVDYKKMKSLAKRLYAESDNTQSVIEVEV